MSAATPSVLVIATSATAASGSVSVAELFVVTGSVTPEGAAIEAVLASDPVAAALTVPVMVNVAVAPTGRFSGVEIDPVPEAAQVAPPATAHVHVAPVKAAGNVSVTVAPVTPEGPALVATTV